MEQQNEPMPPAATSSSSELLQGQAELWCHAFGYLKSVALQCAIKLDIPNAIHRAGGSASLPELLAAVPLATSKQPCLPRLMRFLAASGVFTEVDEADTTSSADGTTATSSVVYRLTAVSRLMVDGIDGWANLSPFAAGSLTPYHFTASLNLLRWLQSKDGDGDGDDSETMSSPFAMAHGTDFWGAASRDAELNAVFNESMACDSRLVAEIVVGECAEVFAGVRSLVDVAGGNGAVAKAIAKAFPHVKCSVLDLPHVVDGIPTDGTVQFIAGDMMVLVPAADVVLLKFVLHDWSDEDCVRILKRCREAIPSEEAGGKVIVIDTVIGSPSKQILEAQLLMDLSMMTLTTGKERDEKEWQKLFKDAGFSRYKIKSILGVRSFIEIYP